MTVPFLQVAEIWVPDPSDTYLELRAGSYGPHHEFRAISQDRHYVRGEGLPGRIWATGQATVLNHFRGGSGFQRVEAAERARLGAGLGLPILHGGRTIAVVVLLCGEAALTPGALEVWSPEGAAGDSLKLHSGYYGDFDGFRRLSAAVRFERGAGLPGRAWLSQLPELLPNVSHSDSFVRAAAAITYDLTTGLSWPCYGETAAVAVMLGTKSTPIARAVEVWVPDDRAKQLSLRAAEYRELPPVMTLEPGAASVKAGEGAIGRAFREGLPQVIEGAENFGTRTHSAFACGVNRGVVIPVISADTVKAVVALFS